MTSFPTGMITILTDRRRIRREDIQKSANTTEEWPIPKNFITNHARAPPFFISIVVLFFLILILF